MANLSPAAAVTSPAALRQDHVVGLDALRIVAAVWVVVSHIGSVPLVIAAGVDKSHPLGYFLWGLTGVLHCGPAAVMVFFVISGFCIHFPYANGAPLHVPSFLVRRYMRIVLPMAAAMAFTAGAGIDAVRFFDAVLWSLVAELMYYTLYPLLRPVVSAQRVNAVVAVCYMLSLAVVATVAVSRGGGYGVYGWTLNWLVGLPCWMLGVKLAAAWQNREARIDTLGPGARIWRWRLLVWGVSCLCMALNFHTPIGYGWTMGLFTLLAYRWILLEMRRANGPRPPWKVLEWAGRWSYSLYLCHMAAARYFDSFGLSSHGGLIADWALKMVFILLTSYLFYLVVEYPSHLGARWLGRRFAAGPRYGAPPGRAA